MLDVLNLITRTADGVFAIDPDGRIILWNPSAQETLEYTPEDVLGKRCYEVLPGRDPAGNLFCFKGCSVVVSAQQGDLIRNYDVQVMTKTGRMIWLNVSIVLIPSHGRAGPIIVHLFRPVGGLQLAEALTRRVTASVLASLHEARPVSDPEDPPLSVPSPSLTSLTRRESEILLLITQCRGSKEIADRLCISYATVRTHIQNILKKLQVHSKLEAVALAFRQNLIQVPINGHSSTPSRLQPLQD
jgi:PAS domain S-box-containing protein